MCICTDSYNKRHASDKEGRPPVLLAAYPQAQTFKEQHILAHIAAHDRAHHDFYRWLRLLHNDVYGFEQWATSKTNLPRPGHKRKASEQQQGGTANGEGVEVPADEAPAQKKPNTE